MISQKSREKGILGKGYSRPLRKFWGILSFTLRGDFLKLKLCLRWYCSYNLKLYVRMLSTEGKVHFPFVIRATHTSNSQLLAAKFPCTKEVENILEVKEI